MKIKNIISQKLLSLWYKSESPSTSNGNETTGIVKIYNVVIDTLFYGLLLILSYFYRLVMTLRYYLYTYGFFKSHNFNIPVIIVGNITVGGTGKTPCVIQLITLLQLLGLRPAVVMRGYGASRKHRNNNVPLLIDSETNIYKSGDEARLIYNATNCPVVISSDRVKSIEYLQKEKLANIIISDDGLQHYKLKRDLEICIIDQSRLLGNKKLLPLGPLREPASRLKKCDFVLSKFSNTPANRDNIVNLSSNIGNMLLKPVSITNIYTGEIFSLDVFKNEIINNNKSSIYAFAAIGNNSSFFETLRKIGICDFREREFIDHYNYKVQDFNVLNSSNALILTTEKDAVKINCLKHHISNASNIYYLSVAASFDYKFIIQFIDRVQTLSSQYNLQIDTTQVEYLLNKDKQAETSLIID